MILMKEGPIYMKKWQNKKWLEKEYNKYGSSTIANKLGINDATIMYWLKKFNIKTRTRSESLKITQNRKGLVNREYFKTIDTEEKAYWLGFLIADGSLNKKKYGYHTSFELSIQDKSVVEKFAEDISYKGKIYLTNTRARLSISDTIFSSELLKYGFSNQKTFNEKFPDKEIIDKSLIKYFILGYFDGDGSIMFYKEKNRVRARFHLVCGNRNFLEKIKEVLEENGIKFSKKSLHKKYTGCKDVYELESSSLENIVKIADYFYFNNIYFSMNRKKDKFKEIINHYKKNPLNIKRYSPNFMET